MSEQEPQEEALARAWQGRRDRAALERLVRIVWPEAFRLAWRYLGDAAAAEDVAQEACARLTRATLALERPGEVRRWLGTVVLNLARNQARARGRRSSHEQRAARREAGAAGRSPDAGLEAAELREHLRRLPAELAEPLLLHYWEALDQRAVAEQLGCSKSTVSTRIQRGLEQLSRSLAGAGLAFASPTLLEQALRAAAPVGPPGTPPDLERLLRRASRGAPAALLLAAVLLGPLALLAAWGLRAAPTPVAAVGPPGPGAAAAPVAPPDTRAAPAPATTRIADPDPAPAPGGAPPPAPAEPAAGPAPPARRLPALACAGRVLELERLAPLAGAELLAIRLGDQSGRLVSELDEARTVADAQGRWRLELESVPLGPGEHDGGWVLVARARGHAPFLRRLPPGDARGADLDLLLAPGGLRVRGWVVDAAGRPRGGLRVRAQADLDDARASGLLLGETAPPETWAEGGSVTFSAMTDAAGRFELDGLPELLEVELGVVEGQGVTTAGAVTRPDREPQEVRLVVLPAARLEARVRDVQGRPVSAAVVRVDRADGRWREEARTRADGGGALELPPGQYRYRIALPRGDDDATRERALGIADLSGEVTLAEGETRRVELQAAIGAGSLCVRLRTPAGAPLPGARVRLERDGDDLETSSDAAGEARFAGLPPGPYRVEIGVAASPDFAPDEARELQVGPGTELELTLSPPVRARGRAVDASGAPVAGATVSLCRGTSESSRTIVVTETDPQGEFALELGPDALRVELEAPGLRPAQAELDLAALARGGVLTLVLLRPTRLQVLAELATPVPDGTRALVTLGHADGYVGRWGTVRGGRVELTFEEPDPRAGWVCLRVGTWQPLERALTAREGRFDLGRVELERGHTLRGRVVGPDGLPRAKAQVSAWPGDAEHNLGWTDMFDVEADAEGRFELRGLPARRLELSARHEGQWGELAVDPLAGAELGDVRLTRSGW